MATRVEGRPPDKPTKLTAGAWGGVVKRTFREFSADNATDWAAALTYYAILSIFPALIALVSILGLVGQSATKPLLDNLGSDVTEHLDRTAQERLDATRARLVTAEAVPAKS